MVMAEDLHRLALKWALKNAVEHGGKAAVGPVIAKLVAEAPELKRRIGEVKDTVSRVVEEVNRLQPEEQRDRLAEIAPELLERKHAREEKRLPPLPGAERGRVVTRLPPEPSGPMHLGHAMSGLLNEMYARQYDGKLWLRFEDTNPRKAKLEYYEVFRRGYRWLGIEWDYEKNNSDDMKLYYEYAEKLLRGGQLYVCACSADELSVQRRTMEPCKHRGQSVEDNLELWKRMFDGDFREGEAAVRLRGDLKSNNTAMRDPVMFRVVEHPHPLTGDEYRVWPTYDFAAAVQDAICGVTHVLRSSEFAFRDELQNHIRNLLGMRNPIIIEYSRFEFKGTPTSKRLITPLIEEGLVSGWDDPRLATVEGVRRRGILPEAIREFTVTQTGFSYAKREYDWSLLYSINRRILDPRARRLFFVPSPVKLVVAGAPMLSVEIPYHPSRDMGKRTLSADGVIYVARADMERLKPGDEFRLKQLMNVRLTGIKDGEAYGEFLGVEPKPDIPIIQWVGEDNVAIRVLKPLPLYNETGELNRNSMETITGLAEPSVKDVAVDEIVQFERFGFCRRDHSAELVFIYAHD